MILAWPCFACQSFEGSRAVLHLEAEVLEITEPGRAENEKQLAQKTVQRAGKATWMLCRELNSLHSIQAVAHWVVGGRYPMPLSVPPGTPGLALLPINHALEKDRFSGNKTVLTSLFPCGPRWSKGEGSTPEALFPEYFQRSSKSERF